VAVGTERPLSKVVEKVVFMDELFAWYLNVWLIVWLIMVEEYAYILQILLSSACWRGSGRGFSEL
jgi:hypothetical protein